MISLSNIQYNLTRRATNIYIYIYKVDTNLLMYITLYTTIILFNNIVPSSFLKLNIPDIDSLSNQSKKPFETYLVL